MIMQPVTSRAITPGTTDPLQGPFGPKPSHFSRLMTGHGIDSHAVFQCDCFIKKLFFYPFKYSVHLFSLVN